MPDLLNTADALRHILADFQPLPPENIPIADTLNRVLAEPIYATTALPPFANSSMDGFAVRAQDLTGATLDEPVQLPVVMDIPAGHAPSEGLKPHTAARIMTGAPLPEGADAVIPMEDTDAAWAVGDAAPTRVSCFQAVQKGSNVRPIGEDIPAGELVLEANTILNPAEIGVLAALGYANVPVVKQPTVAILATGDELVDPGDELMPGKIRNSNSYVLEALVKQTGGIPIRLPIAADTSEAVRRHLDWARAQQPAMILSSGGVSVGAHDVVRSVLDEMGEVQLWRVNLRPGKPLAYGHVSGIPFFGLPGNPVSAQVTFDIFVRPALLKLGSRPDVTPHVEAVLDEDISTDGRLTYFRVQLRHATDGQLHATTTGTQSSGAMRSMVLADGLLIVPAGEKATAGSRYTVRLLRALPGATLQSPA